MLADPRADALATRFAGQWLRLQDIEKVRPDVFWFPDYDEQLGLAMQKETELFFGDIVRHDRSMLTLLTANYTFVNERLARHYGFKNISGDQFRRVTYPDSTRRGILGQGSMLVQTSLANRTSPVLRGKWVMEVVIGMPPPPPPPNVPSLDETTDGKDGKPLTTRERMELHRKNITCRTCHQYMDPIGLALDNFDVTGRWRYRENAMPLDTRGQLYDGTPVSTPSQLTRALLKRPTPFVRHFTENLMAYALGRRVADEDQPTIRAIASRGARERLQILVVRHGRREQQRVPHAHGRAAGGRGRRSLAALTDRSRRNPDADPGRKGDGAPHVPPRDGCHDRAPVPRRDGAGVPFAREGRAARRRRPTRRGSCAWSSCTAAPDRNTWGASKHLWAPAEIGRNFQLNPDGALAPLEPWRDYLTIVSNTDVRMAEAFEAPEIGGDHFRSSAVFLTQSHPKQTQGSDVYVGTSLDQIVARRIAGDTAIPSMQLCIENQDRGGGCDYNYACAYTDTLSWASPTDPLPMIRNPRIAFDVLFGAGSNNTDRAVRRKANQSILDWIVGDLAGLKRDLGPTDRQRIDKYLSDIRELERRIQAVEAQKRERRAARAARGAVRRAGFVRRAHEAHVRHPGARVRVGHDARVLVQDGTRCVDARVSGERHRQGVPPGVASRRTRVGDPRLQQDQPLSRQHAAVLPRQAEEHEGRRQQPARQDGDRVRLADGGWQHPQPSPLPAAAVRQGQWPAAGQHASQGA